MFSDFYKKIDKNIDWVLVFLLLPILGAGLITMKSFSPGASAGFSFFEKQLIWIVVSFAIFFILSSIDLRFLKRTDILVWLFLSLSFLLVLLFVFGHRANGAKSWFSLGGFAFQPSDFMKVVLVLILSKYFSRRHIEIADFKHILISGIYAFIPFFLIFLEPDFGGAIMIFIVWLGMILVSGISKRHLLTVFLVTAASFLVLWLFIFKPYQKARIRNFLHPLTDVRGSGYNAYQSTIAVGSGQMFGKGVGYGTQSRLNFLPEYQTDFIFAAFAEEWGYVGVLILLLLYGLVIWRILQTALTGAGNFEMLYGMGVAVFLVGHILINVGMNIGILPVTGVTLPFMSYGGSHLLNEFIALGILMSMRRQARAAHRDDMRNEFLGI
jgi:rod shape determining protein RodA